MQLGEVWRNVPGEWSVRVSSWGRIDDHRDLGPRYYDRLSGDGTPLLDWQEWGLVRVVPVWRLVMNGFYDVKSYYNISVEYKDGDILNNSLRNLKFYFTPPSGKKQPIYPVKRMTEDGEEYLALDKRFTRAVRILETGEIFPSGSAAARAVGGDQGNVHRVLSGKLKTHKGYHFEYVEDDFFDF